MGVMACGREGCEHILCDHMVLGNYLCNECISELKESRKLWPGDISVGEVNVRILAFLETEPTLTGKARESTDPEDVEKEFQKAFWWRQNE